MTRWSVTSHKPEIAYNEAKESRYKERLQLVFWGLARVRLDRESRMQQSGERREYAAHHLLGHDEKKQRQSLQASCNVDLHIHLHGNFHGVALTESPYRYRQLKTCCICYAPWLARRLGWCTTFATSALLGSARHPPQSVSTDTAQRHL